MKTTPDNQKLFDLIQGARTGKIVLPQFQRNFVWSRDDITDLLRSVMQGYFIGSFLLLRTSADEVPFAVRTIEGVDSHPGQLRPNRMILDGQQRLTSLHYVFAAPSISLRWTKYPYRFFLSLDKVTAGELEEAIWSERADRVEGWLQRPKQFETLQIPFTVLEDWNKWLHAYERWLIERDREAYFEQYFKRNKPAWNAVVNQISAFLVPTIEIPKIPSDDPESIAQVCAIFEKMNSTGVRLSVYDLLTARMYKYGIDMHQLWEETVEQYELLNTFSDGKPDNYGVFLLRTIALLRGLDVKSKTLINLAPTHFNDDWRRAAGYMEAALQRITSTNVDGFGVFNVKWLPYSTMISPMAALLAEIGENNHGHQAYKLLRRWYWSSIFRERYAGAVESTVYRDFQDLAAVCRGEDKEPDALTDAETAIVNNPTYSLLDVARVNSVYKGVMCLVAKRGTKDFRSDDSITFHALDDHHIFPKAFLRQERRSDGSTYPSNLTNSIVNRTLISSSTNRRISRMAPSQYLKRLVPDKRASAIMDSHFIGTDALEAMRTDDFEMFLLAREQELVKVVRNCVLNGDLAEDRDGDL